MKKNKITTKEFEPLRDFIIAKPFSQKQEFEIEARKTGIALPTPNEKKGRTIWATVIAVGPTTQKVSVNDVILLSEYDSYEIRLHGEEYLVVREEFVFSIYK